LILLGSARILCACAATPATGSAVVIDTPPTESTHHCNAERYKAGDEAPKSLAWPDRLLRAGSSDAYTLNYSADRMNIEVDRDGRVVRAWCG
jgi:hypothetical protein